MNLDDAIREMERRAAFARASSGTAPYIAEAEMYEAAADALREKKAREKPEPKRPTLWKMEEELRSAALGSQVFNHDTECGRRVYANVLAAADIIKAVREDTVPALKAVVRKTSNMLVTETTQEWAEKRIRALGIDS